MSYGKPHNDTSEIHLWLASQLKLEDVPEPIWNDLVEEGYVKEAQDLDFPDGREELLRQARRLLKAFRAGAGAGPAPKKQPTGKRQRATARRRFEVVAEISAKFAQAKAAKDPGASNGHEEKVKNLTPEQREFAVRTRALAESPISSTIENNRITVRAEPWVSSQEVRKWFEDARDMWFWTPTPSARRVELVSFVVGFCESHYDEKHNVFSLIRGPGWPGWRGIMEKWNQRCPQGHEWHYTDHRSLRRDFREAARALTLHKEF